jgi:UDP-N-acetylmuramate dehydrogenase
MSAFDYDDIIVCLEDIVKKERIKTNVPMKEHTTMRVGGMAKIMVLPESCNEIAGIKKLLTEKKVPHFIMGNGSNLVVADSGYSGVIIKLSDNFSGISAERDEITALAGTNIAAVSNAALKHSLSGLEFAAGIPRDNRRGCYHECGGLWTSDGGCYN